MKTRIDIGLDIFYGGIDGTIDHYNAGCKNYEDYYKQYGFILDEENETVYKIYDKEVNLSEGDRVELFGFRLVVLKYVDIENDLITYCLEYE